MEKVGLVDKLHSLIIIYRYLGKEKENLEGGS